MKVFDRHKLRNIRELKGYSLEMMARMLAVRSELKISRSAISHWEQGSAKPSLTSLAALSELFGVPIDYFFAHETNYLFDEAGDAGSRTEA
jgi:transcriptional regulator with XRE-family HTH domain